MPLDMDYGFDDNDDLAAKMGIGPDPEGPPPLPLNNGAKPGKERKMAEKTHDLCVKTGEYTDRNGQTKNSYENIGNVMKSDKGAYLLLKKTFNPAGVDTGGKGMVMVSLFKVKDEQR